MIEASSQQSRSAEHDARSEYLAPLPPSLAHREFDRAVRLLAPTGTPRLDVVALFDGRAQWETIKSWRRGVNPIPAWARDLLRAKLEAAGRPFLNASNTIAAIEPGRGKDWRRTKT